MKTVRDNEAISMDDLIDDLELATEVDNKPLIAEKTVHKTPVKKKSSKASKKAKKEVKKSTSKTSNKKTVKKKTLKKKTSSKTLAKTTKKTPAKVSTKKTKKTPTKTTKKTPKKTKPEGYVFGRPTKHRKGMAERFLKYVDEDRLSMTAAAHKLGIHYETLTEWARIHPDFTESHIRAKEITRDRIIEMGMTSVSNPQFSMFLLKANHGMMEADKRKSLELKERELDAKIAGDISDGTEVNISFGLAPKPNTEE